MKKIILTMAAIATLAVTMATSYGQEPDKQSQKARENLKEEQKDVVDAKKDLAVAQKDSVSDYQNFKKESDIKIKNNEKSIADLKVKSAKISQKDQATYQKKVGELEQKNTTLKNELADYKQGTPDKWSAFKTEFNHDMNDLGKAIKDFTVDNKL
jgi:Ni/Co efflux regulator RcnB